MESQARFRNNSSEVVIDIEPFIKDVKPEPIDQEDNQSEEEPDLDMTDYYDEDYQENGESDDETMEETYDNDEESDEFAEQHIKLEPIDDECEDVEPTTDDEENISNGNNESEGDPATPSTSKKDNEVYFEIPIVNNYSKCVVCGLSFSNNNKNKQNYICKVCLTKNDFTKPKRTLRNGKVSFHGAGGTAISGNAPVVKKRKKYIQPKPYECDECSRRCKSVSDLTKHKFTHTGERPFACDVCPKRFNQLSNLVRHKSTHSDIKPYKCPVCAKSFTQASYLKKHNLTHSGEKPYGCLVCLKRFSDYSTLSKHKLIHSGEKPYMCGICFKKFNQLASLRRHEVIHRDEKPFECKICSKRFAQSHHLKRHQTIHRVMFVDMTATKKKKYRKTSAGSKGNQDEDHELTFSDITSEMNNYEVAYDNENNYESSFESHDIKNGDQTNEDNREMNDEDLQLNDNREYLNVGYNECTEVSDDVKREAIGSIKHQRKINNCSGNESNYDENHELLNSYNMNYGMS